MTQDETREVMRFIAYLSYKPTPGMVDYMCKSHNPEGLDTVAMTVQLKHEYADTIVSQYLSTRRLYEISKANKK